MRERCASFRPCLTLMGTLVLGLAGCSSSAQLDGVQAQLSQVHQQLLQIQTQGSSKQELEELEQVLIDRLAVLLKSEADTQVDVEQLARQIGQLLARLEEIDQRIGELSRQTKATQEELQALRALPNLVNPRGEGPEPLPPEFPSDPEGMYRSAYSDYLQGKYDLAIAGFGRYVAAFPQTEQTDNALYWLGECYYSQNKYRQAIAEFRKVERLYPQSDKLASALLKWGYAHLEIGERAEGVAQLQKVRQNHPESEEAILAGQRLVGLDGR